MVPGVSNGHVPVTVTVKDQDRVPHTLGYKYLEIETLFQGMTNRKGKIAIQMVIQLKFKMLTCF